MSTMAILVMVSICTLVWGGFGLLLTRAIRSERRKASSESPRATEL